jgi:hypothetical protein
MPLQRPDRTASTQSPLKGDCVERTAMSRLPSVEGGRLKAQVHPPN